MRRQLTLADVGHVYGVDPGQLWFSGCLAGGPITRLLGRRATVHLTNEAALRLAIELLAIVSARYAGELEAGR